MILTVVRRQRSLVALLAVSILIRAVYVKGVWRPETAVPSTELYYQIPTFLAFFVGGMVAANARRVVTTDPDRGAMATGAGVALLLGVFSLSGLPGRTLLTGPISIVLTLACILVVGLISWAPNPSGSRCRWLFASLGAVSYGTYLLHQIVYDVVRRVTMPAWVAVAVTVVVTLLLAWCSYRWFERPVANWARQRFRVSPSRVVSRFDR